MIEIKGKQLCSNCFEELTGELCPNCGSDTEAIVDDLTNLPPGNILIGKYIVGKVMGKGGFGITYMAYDVNEEKKVAVKEFFPYGVAVRTTGYTTVSVTSADKADIFKLGSEKFYNEAKLVSKFSGNPNIVNVYGFFYENNTVYFSMEYLKGHTLKDHIQEYGLLNASQAVFIIQCMANALAAAHDLSVLHRDISPDNIIICDNGDVKLIDFGAARQVVAEQSQSFSVILKPGFAPLEQYQKKGHQGPWTDIYSLGATIYYALTGEIPEDPMSRMDDDEEYRSNKHRINSDLWQIISKATELKIENRYENISQLRNDLNMISIEAAPLVVPGSVRPFSMTQAVQQTVAADTQTQSMAYNQTEAYSQPLQPVQQTVAVGEPTSAKKRSPLLFAICGVSAAAIIAAAIIIPISLNSSQKDISASGGQDGDSVVTSGSDDVVVENVVDREFVIYNGMTIIYTGEWVNEMPEGQGKAIYESGSVYEGEWKSGMRCGEGQFTGADGRSYVGEWENDNFHGYGKHTWANGDVYEGEWENGQQSGQGKFIYENGDVYEGEWKDGKSSGQGKYTWANGDFYEGEFEDDLRNGQGVMTYDEGSVYEGEYKDDFKSGQGKMVYSDGRVYQGEWKDGRRSGQGKMIYPNGDVYEGEWGDDLFNGYGKYTWLDGEVYEGEFKDDVISGQGKKIYSDGNVYEGQWEDGIRSGQGTLTGADGSVYEGDWKNDLPNGYGKYTWPEGEFYEGEWVDGVQNGYGVLTYPDGSGFKGNWKDGKLEH